MSDAAVSRTGHPWPLPLEGGRFRVMDVGGSHVTAAVVELDSSAARIVARADRLLDPHASAAELLDTLADTARALGPGDERWAVAVPGPFDFENGRGDFAGVEKFSALSGVDLRAELASRLQVVPEQIGFLHDAVAYAAGEWSFGAGELAERLTCITLGTGVGSAFLDRGQAVTDRPDVPESGTVHLLTIGGRPLEDTVSTRAMVAAYARVSGTRLDVRSIFDRARQADEQASRVVDTAIVALGSALAPWFQSFGTSVVVVGGAIAGSWDLIEAPFRRGIAAFDGSLSDRLVLRKSVLGDEAPLIGAAVWLARSQVPRT